VKIPLGYDITDGENHRGYEDLMGPEGVKQKVVKHDNSSIPLARNFSEDLASGLILRRTNCVNPRTYGSHPKQVHHDGHH
jgi:hypothetical protein